MLWPQSLCDLIVAETNRYARLRKKGNWADVDREEMWTFMGINILMGIHRLPRISNYWSRDGLLGIPALKGTCVGTDFGKFGPICMLWTTVGCPLVRALVVNSNPF